VLYDKCYCWSEQFQVNKVIMLSIFILIGMLNLVEKIAS
jgi:hypothetical protein